MRSWRQYAAIGNIPISGLELTDASLGGNLACQPSSLGLSFFSGHADEHAGGRFQALTLRQLSLHALTGAGSRPAWEPEANQGGFEKGGPMEPIAALVRLGSQWTCRSSVGPHSAMTRAHHAPAGPS
jgi:hypothetical protein